MNKDFQQVFRPIKTNVKTLLFLLINEWSDHYYRHVEMFCGTKQRREIWPIWLISVWSRHRRKQLIADSSGVGALAKQADPVVIGHQHVAAMWWRHCWRRDVMFSVAGVYHRRLGHLVYVAEWRAQSRAVDITLTKQRELKDCTEPQFDVGDNISTIFLFPVYMTQ